MEFCKHNWATISETICPQNAYFWQVGLVDIVLSEYLDKSHNFRNFIFMTSQFSTLIPSLLQLRHSDFSTFRLVTLVLSSHHVSALLIFSKRV